VEVTVNSMEQKSQYFCPSYFKEYPLCILQVSFFYCPISRVQSTYVSLGLDSIENIVGREQDKDYNRTIERLPNFQEMTLSVSADVSRRTADVGMDV
jgi:hypothetical protein